MELARWRRTQADWVQLRNNETTREGQTVVVQREELGVIHILTLQESFVADPGEGSAQRDVAPILLVIGAVSAGAGHRGPHGHHLVHNVGS